MAGNPDEQSADAPADRPAKEREFGWQGWLLVGAVFVAFVVVPGTIYLNAIGVGGLPFRFTFLVLPLLPAVLLALLAVWITTTE